jgi:serine protease Do
VQGEVVGLNSQIYSGTGGFMGLSFAVPIDVAVKVADQLRRHGQVTGAAWA